MHITKSWKDSPTAKGCIGIGSVTMKDYSVKLSNAEMSLLQQIDKLVTAKAQGELRELISDFYFSRNG
ncbi:hypothetical protein [Herbaspirillum seropedicae]|uniref:hypothetical protein n=1 Tax=Herbaspirillum seropedicae TaxID=964 RepID=UPI0012EAAA54|nr:hypothetical protein [Herbaspirillum seropedicae]MDR6397351.1 hypothetical protein [Herbaspirillum seropedicae]